MDNKALLDRRLVAVTGQDGLGLLDKLTSQDLSGVGPQLPAAYTLLLTPQGKYLYDFFVVWADAQLYLDTAAHQTDALIATLNKYKLRSDVAFSIRDDLFVHLGQSAHGEIAVRDPRADGLGYRCWTAEPASADSDYVQTLTRLGIIEPSLELPAQAMPIEYGLQHMHAISFDKGCYMGQELTARMQHKNLAKHALVVAKVKDNQQLAGDFDAAVFDTQGTQIGHCIRMAHPYALLHVTRDAADADASPVFQMQRSQGGAKIELARN